MNPHFFKAMGRGLSRNKTFTVINILGLSIGLACVLLIALLIGEILRVDQFHEKKDRLYCVYKNEKQNSQINIFKGSSSLLGPNIKTNYLGAEDVVRIFTDHPSTFVFVDEDYQQKFRGSRNLGQLILLFASLSIFISSLGLYGLVVFMAISRIKEIGIRKVLGASVVSIATLLSRDYLRLVLISFVIGSPIAWWMMQSWLARFSSRITISWWMFAICQQRESQCVIRRGYFLNR